MEMAGEVSRIFMGVQIQCAQCHDHKTDAWKRRAVPRVRGVLRRSAGQAGRHRACPGSCPSSRSGSQAGRGTRCPTRTNPRQADPVAPQFFLASREGPTPPLPETSAPSSAGRWSPRTSPVKTTPGSPGRSSTGCGTPSWARPSTTPIDDIGPERTPKAPRCSSRWPTSGRRAATTSAGSSARS